MDPRSLPEGTTWFDLDGDDVVALTPDGRAFAFPPVREVPVSTAFKGLPEISREAALARLPSQAD